MNNKPAKSQNNSQIILGSSSKIRAKLLKDAGIDFEIHPPDFDETAFKTANPFLLPAQLAALLAEKKAQSILAPKDAIVIGSDQILEVDGQALDKANSMKEAKERLMSLRGRAHYLTGCTVLVKNHQTVAELPARSKLVMRNFSENELDAYLQATGKRILHSVGCYELEKQGVTLFEAVEGDHFAILGLSLFDLFDALRAEGAMLE